MGNNDDAGDEHIQLWSLNSLPDCLVKVSISEVGAQMGWSPPLLVTGWWQVQGTNRSVWSNWGSQHNSQRDLSYFYLTMSFQSYCLQCQMVRWFWMNCEGCGGNRSCLTLRYQLSICLKGLRKMMKNLSHYINKLYWEQGFIRVLWISLTNHHFPNVLYSYH
jgi:hypothetical protein